MSTVTKITPSPSARLLAIVRKPNGLIAVVNQPRYTSEQIESCSKDKASGKIDWARFYETYEMPLADVPLSLFARKKRLLDSWDALRCIRDLDAEVLSHVLFVLLETSPGSVESDTPLPPLDVTLPSQRPQSTAAHPRAFQGTKYQPPKQKQLTVSDLRPYLCSTRELQRLLTRLHPYLSTALARLEAVGYSRAHITKVQQAIARSFQCLVTGMPDGAVPPRTLLNSPLFTQHILPSIRELSPQEIREYQSLFHALALKDDCALCSAVARFISLQSSPETRAWCRLIARLPMSRRSSFVTHLLESETYRCDPNLISPVDFDEFTRLTPDAYYHTWTLIFLEAIRKNVNLSYALAGLRLAATFKLDRSFTITGDCTDFPYDTVESLVLSFPDDSPEAGWYAIRSWERCGQLLGFADILRKTQWHCFSPDIARGYLSFLLNFIYHDVSGAALEKKWEVVKEELPRIEYLIQTTSTPYQERVLGELRGYLWQWDTPEEIRLFLPGAYLLSRRVSAPPFRANAELSHIFASFLDIKDEAIRHSFLTAPDASFQALEKCCRRENAARLIARGLYSITRVFAALAVRTFARFSDNLCKVAQVFGGLSFERRSVLLQQLTRHPLFAKDIASLPPKDACLLVQHACAGRYWNPIPRRFAEWAAGIYTLTPTRIERYRQVLLEKLDLTRLDMIKQRVIEELSLGFPVDRPSGKGTRHALLMLGAIDENRRGLRRFLHARWRGNENYLLRHPATQTWLRQHPRVNVQLLTNGIPFQEWTDTQEISITIEREPLEVLRLGTYVGSCLGLGGLCDYSSAAVLLDINKQVLYAKDRHGGIVARQLVAISKDDCLVCFHVYPASVPAYLKVMFRRYDTAFAKALGLTLHIPKTHNDESYEIEQVLSQRWWDDGAWDFDGKKSHKKIRSRA